MRETLAKEQLADVEAVLSPVEAPSPPGLLKADLGDQLQRPEAAFLAKIAWTAV